VEDGLLIAVWSPLIICEVNKLLTWLWIERHGGSLSDSAWRQCSSDFRKWHTHVAIHFRVIEDRPPQVEMWTQNPRDPWDQPIWTAAVRSQDVFQATHVLVITENLIDGPPPDRDGVRHHEGVLYVHPDELPHILSLAVSLTLAGGAHGEDEHVPDAIRELLTSLKRSPKPGDEDGTARAG
jgi:hypothetical protein